MDKIEESKQPCKASRASPLLRPGYSRQLVLKLSWSTSTCKRRKNRFNLAWKISGHCLFFSIVMQILVKLLFECGADLVVRILRIIIFLFHVDFQCLILLEPSANQTNQQKHLNRRHPFPLVYWTTLLMKNKLLIFQINTSKTINPCKVAYALGEAVNNLCSWI